MKKLVLMFVMLIPFLSCKKESPKTISFSISFARIQDSVYYDSVAFAVINYSEMSEIRDSSDLNNPEVFSQTVKVEKPYTLTFESGQTCVIKKFDLINRSGEVIFYVPYGVQHYYVNNIQYDGIGLPFIIKAEDGVYTIMVTKK